MQSTTVLFWVHKSVYWFNVNLVVFPSYWQVASCTKDSSDAACWIMQLTHHHAQNALSCFSASEQKCLHFVNPAAQSLSVAAISSVCYSHAIMRVSASVWNKSAVAGGQRVYTGSLCQEGTDLDPAITRQKTSNLSRFISAVHLFQYDRSC